MRKLAFLVAIIILPLTAHGQSTGVPPFGSLSSTPFDVVNNQNLNAYFSIPVFSSSGRGMPLTLNLANNSLVWQPMLVGSTTTWTPVTDVNGNPTWGWQKDLPPGGTVNYQTTSSQVKCFTSGNNWYWATITHYRFYSYIDVYGTNHNFNEISIQESDCPLYNTGGTFTGSAGDASGYYMDATTPTAPKVTSASGVQGVNGQGTAIDANGNYVTKTVVSSTETDWTDSVGNTALKILYTGSSTNPTQIQYKFLDGTGASNYQTITLTFTPYNIKTNFGCSGVSEYTSSGQIYLPYQLEIPSPVSGTIIYTFGYEPTPAHSGYITGRIKTVTLPTGGSYEYDYTGSYDGINCADGTTVGMNRKVTNGSDTATWNFVRSGSTTTATTPALADTSSANDTVYTLNSSGEETSRQIYGNSPHTGNAVRTINTTWASNGTPATQVTILEDSSTQSQANTNFDLYGNLLSLAEYDWGSGAHGALIRTTNYTYLGTTPYTSRNIVNLVTEKQITDSNGTIQYRQDIAYDASSLTCPTGAAQHDDTDYPCSMVYRGDPTSITTYTVPAGPSGGITKNFTYDWFGNQRSADLNCCQEKTWAYSSTTQYSQPDSVTSGTSPTQLTTYATYNLYTGWMNTSTDENGQVTQYSYDFLRRPTKVVRPDGTAISQSYNDTAFTSTLKTPIDSGKLIQQISTVDHLGYPNLSTIEDGSNNVYSVTQTLNNVLGRAYRMSNPYTGSPSNWTSISFDALGRPTATTLQDGSMISYSYSAKTTTVSDPASKKRESVIDGSGRLTSIYEPDSGNNLTVPTSYTYTVLDGLATVTEGSQTRTYSYDGLGRLLTRAEPEIKNVGGQGQYQYSYNSYDLVTQRTDPRGVITTYGYDTLNRLQTISYNVGSTGVAATAGVTLTYGTIPSQNNNGRLITMTDGVGSENYSYDILGRMTQLQKVIGTTTYTTAYGYNLGNELIQITYPSGRVVQQAVDPIGRLCAIAQTATNCTTTTNPFSNAYQYNPASQLTSFNYGNGVASTFGYSSDRSQLTSLSYVKGTNTLYSLNYWYKTDSSHCPTGASGNNGQIQCITDSVDNGRSVAYTYDTLARLASAVTTGSSGYAKWGLSWTYDRYGNRWTQSVTSGTAPSNSVTVDASSNRITTSGYAYDPNGNMTNDGSNTLSYDAENRLITSSGSLGSATYTYDGNNLRVKRTSSGVTSVIIYSGGKYIADYASGAAPSSPSDEYIYSEDQIIAAIQSGSTYYFHNDHLSLRVRTNSSGTIQDQSGTYPFGETWYSPSGEPWMFTDYVRDGESGNDYAYARFYVNRLARFSALDPVPGSTADPQTLDMYEYSSNDPINMSDLAGLCPNWYGTPFIVNGYVICTSATPLGGGGDIIGGLFVVSLGPCLNCAGFSPDNPPPPGFVQQGYFTWQFIPIYGPVAPTTFTAAGGQAKKSSAKGKESFAECTKVLANVDSLQNLFHMGNGFAASAFFSNTFSSGIQLAQDFSQLRITATGNDIAQNAASFGAVPLAQRVAKSLPNIAVSVAAGSLTASSNGLQGVMVSGTATVSLGALLKGVAGVVGKAANIKTIYDAGIATGAAVVCALQ